MADFDFYSVGHSNIPIGRFVTMLQTCGVDAIADVRSTPVSRFAPWFSAKALTTRLRDDGIGYEMFGASLGGRPTDPRLYRDGIADYEAMARQPGFVAGTATVLALAARCRVCLMCAERDPLDCHRCLLVARSLAARGKTIGHILYDGSVEPHSATEQRLLAHDSAAGDLFSTGQNERLAAAYLRRAHDIAYRLKADAAKARGAKVGAKVGAKSVAEGR